KPWRAPRVRGATIALDEDDDSAGQGRRAPDACGAARSDTMRMDGQEESDNVEDVRGSGGGGGFGGGFGFGGGRGIGLGTIAMGPFYCPGDRKVYLDTSFFRVMSQRLGAPGQFAQAYVIGHEVGHHVQNLLGISDKVDAMRRRGSEAQANAMSVRLELQADCF